MLRNLGNLHFPITKCSPKNDRLYGMVLNCRSYLGVLSNAAQIERSPYADKWCSCTSTVEFNWKRDKKKGWHTMWSTHSVWSTSSKCLVFGAYSHLIHWYSDILTAENAHLYLSFCAPWKKWQRKVVLRTSTKAESEIPRVIIACGSWLKYFQRPELTDAR